ncbi:MAG: patatin-like phospholipase family protein, partial [Chloroflexota bacterium]|nr:patatin-like phospholipase family protein [Chloroflexota bacterium]
KQCSRKEMTSNELQQFKRLAIFKSIDQDSIDTLYSEGNIVKLRAGQILFSQGSESNYLYILLSGRLVALGTSQQNNTENVYGFIQPGEFVGEMGLISKKPRSLTVRAQLDAILFRLSENKFNKLIDKHPQVVTPITMSVITRLQQTLSNTEGKSYPQSTLLIPANKSVSLNHFETQLNTTLQDQNINYIILTETNMHDQCGINPDWSDVLQWMNNIEQKYSVAIYICTDYDSNWLRYCLQYAERVVLVAYGSTSADYDPSLTNMIAATQHQHFVKELVLLYDQKIVIPETVNEWIKHYQFFRHHHVVLNNLSSMQRFCRFLTAKAKALVLAGGGTRGWAHAGAMRAFAEVGLEFDLIGGTSAGSAAGALYASGADYKEISSSLDALMRASIQVVKPRHFTIPLVSISDASLNTMLLRKTFGDKTIQQLERQFFCVSCDISNNREMIHDQGPLWQAVRASCSVPGLAPPVVIDGDMYVDGGIINNLPVDIARTKLDGAGTIVAVDLSITMGNSTKYHFPPNLSFVDLLAHKLHLAHNHYQFSSLASIIMGTIMACSERRTAENRANTDILITPDLHGYGMVDDARDELMELGYKAAIAAL